MNMSDGLPCTAQLLLHGEGPGSGRFDESANTFAKRRHTSFIVISSLVEIVPDLTHRT